MRLPVLSLLAAAALVAQQEPAFKSGATTVAIYTTVTDSAGRLVPDLKKEDFEIYDNGTRQEITLFESGQQPITVIVMLDRSGSMRGNFNLVRAAAEQFVTRLEAGDKARIGSFADRIQVDPRDFTTSQRDMIEILRTQLQEAGATPLWNAINVGITGLLHQDGRRVVLVFTDGVDRPMNSSGNNVSLKDAMKRAQEEDVMVYAIGLAGRSGFGGRGRRGGFGGSSGGAMPRPRPPQEMDKPDPGLARIAAESGGGYFELTSTNDLSTTFARVAEELHRQYAVAFVPQRLDGKIHKIEVRTRDRFLTARSRNSYIAKKP
jgi:VWFA-related protein